MKDRRTRKLALTHYLRTLIQRLIYVMQHGDPERHTATPAASPRYHGANVAVRDPNAALKRRGRLLILVKIL